MGETDVDKPWSWGQVWILWRTGVGHLSLDLALEAFGLLLLAQPRIPPTPALLPIAGDRGAS